MRARPLGWVLRRAALAFLAAWVLSPFLAFGLVWRVIAFFCMALWSLLELRAPRSVLLRPNLVILLMWGFVLYTVGVEFTVPDAAPISRHYQLWIMFFFLLAAEGARRRNDGELQFMFWVVMLTLPTAIIGTLLGIDTVAHDVARTFTRSSDEARELADMGIGGYGVVYSAVLASPFLALLALRGGLWQSSLRSGLMRKLQRILVTCNWLMCVYLVLRAGYSIALILLVVSTLFIFFVRSRDTVKFGLSTTFSALSALMLVIAAPPLVDALLDLTSGTEYYAKVVDIRDSFTSNESVGTVADRTERYERSAGLFAANPILGVLRFDDVGKHSAILDRLAQYGVVFGALFICLVAFPAWRAVRDPRVPIGLALGFLVLAVGFPMVDNVFSAWGLMLYMFSGGAMAMIEVKVEVGKRERKSKSQVELGNA